MPEEERYVKSGPGMMEAWKKKKKSGKVGAGKVVGKPKPVPKGGIKKKKGGKKDKATIKIGEDIYSFAERTTGNRNNASAILNYERNRHIKDLRGGTVLQLPPKSRAPADIVRLTSSGRAPQRPEYGRALAEGRAATMRPLKSRRKTFTPEGGLGPNIMPTYRPAIRKDRSRLPANYQPILPAGRTTPQPTPAEPWLGMPPERTPLNVDYSNLRAGITPGTAPINYPGGIMQFESNREYVVNSWDRGKKPIYILDAVLHDPAVLEGDTYEEFVAELRAEGYVQLTSGSWVSDEFFDDSGYGAALSGGGGYGGYGNGYLNNAWGYGGYGGGGGWGGGRGGGDNYGYSPSGRYFDYNAIGPISWRI